MEHNSELEFRIIKVETKTELVASSRDINFDTYIDADQDNQII